MPSVCPSCGRPVAASARRCPSCDKVLRSPITLGTPRPAELPPVTRPGQPGPPGQPGQPGQPQRSKAEVRTEAAVEKTRAGVRVGVRLWRRLPRKGKIVLASVIAALVIGVPAALWVVGKVAYAPEEPVEDLVAAFNDRDYTRVAELAGCTGRLCRPGALGAGYTPPAKMEIADVVMGGSTNPDSADVVVSYELAGERRDSVVRVRRESGLLPKSWSIQSGAVGALEVVAPEVKAVRIAGLDIDPSRGTKEPALIGTYSVTVGGDDPLYEGRPIDAVVTGDLRSRPTTSVDVRTSVKQSARDEVNTQVKAFLDQCVASTAVKPRVNGRVCPFSFTGYFPPGSSNVSWTLDPQPVFEVVVPEKRREGVALEVRTTTPGSARFRYTFRDAPIEADPVSVAVKGEVRLTDDKIEFVAT